MAYRYWGAMVLFAIAGPAPAAEQRSFCERMAVQLEMKPVERYGRSTGEWRINVFSPMQRLLTGGSSMISFAMRPAGDVSKASAADYVRLQSTCQQQKKDILCRVEEPMVLIVSVGKNKAEIEALPGERAEVGTRGSQLFCRNPQATTAA